MEDCDSKLHLVRHLDLQGSVMDGVLDCIILRDGRDGQLTNSSHILEVGVLLGLIFL